jgi:hypothetical protein
MTGLMCATHRCGSTKGRRLLAVIGALSSARVPRSKPRRIEHTTSGCLLAMARNGARTQPDLQVLTLVAEFRFESEFGEQMKAIRMLAALCGGGVDEP